MKKLAFVLPLIAIGALNAHAQGTIQFQNSSSFPVQVSDGVNTYVIGTSNAGSWGAGPGQVTIQLYVALASAPSTFYLAGTTTNSGATTALFLGTFHGGSPYSIPASVDGGAFTQGTTIDYYFFAEGTGGGADYFGQSATGTSYVLSGGAGTPPATFGNGAGQIGGFTAIRYTPEPSTLAVGGLGALAALLYRRKKQ